MKRRNVTSGAKKSTATTDVGANAGRDIAVIGGGIGGLTAALCFARTGAVVTVHEQAAAFGEVGAGVQITPNGARVLAALGLDDNLKTRSVQATAVVPTDALSGRMLVRFDLTRLPGPPYRFLYRPDLIAILADACRDAGVRLETGRAVVAADLTARLVVGADGLNSRTRALIAPPPLARFSGQVAWRTIIAQPSPSEARIWMAPGCHVVTYPLAGGRTNVVAVQQRAGWAAEGWHHPDDPANLRTAFAGMCRDLTAILDAVETTSLWGLFRHPVADSWWQPGLAILGDAAHPTLPFLAQGANLAIEDAWVLAASCDSATDLDAGLHRYEALRKPRVTRAIAAADANAVNYHLSGPRRVVSHLALRGIGAVAPATFLKRLAWLYDHDVTGLD